MLNVGVTLAAANTVLLLSSAAVAATAVVDVVMTNVSTVASFAAAKSKIDSLAVAALNSAVS